MKKRILKLTVALVLTVVTVLGLASCTGGNATLPDADSANGSIENTAISWSYDEDTRTLKINGEGAIPNSAASTDVWWYEVRHSVKKVEMSDRITEVGDYAFYYFPLLESINVSPATTRLGKYAFAFCSALKSIEIPDAVGSVGEGCFEACTSLESVFLSANVTSLGARAFARCPSLKEAVIMAQLTSLEAETFKGCKSLESLVFSKAVEGMTVADSAFAEAGKSFANAVFTESTTGEVKLTVKYVFEDGSEAAKTFEKTFKRGASYSEVSPTIDGYTADKLTVSGNIGTDTTETVTYRAIVTEEASTEAETQAPESAPVTDENDEIGVGTIITIVIFVVVIGAIIVLAVLMMRSDKKQSNAKGTGKNNSRKK